MGVRMDVRMGVRMCVRMGVRTRVADALDRDAVLGKVARDVLALNVTGHAARLAHAPTRSIGGGGARVARRGCVFVARSQAARPLVTGC